MNDRLPEAARFNYPRYQYEPLQNPDHIRLICLKPASEGDSPLICDVKQHNFKDHTLSFEAISYTWGQPVFPEKLFSSCLDAAKYNDAAVIPITENLATALRIFRRSDSVRYIWVDAVCIDQSNNLERNVQVAMMKQIYQTASSVLVWLGEADSDTTPALDFCRMLAAELPACGLDISDPFRWPKNDTPPLQAARQKLAYDPNLQAGGIALRNLVHRTWFSRRWIIQEVYLGQHVILHIGSHELPWNIFSLSMGLVAQLRRDQYIRAGNAIVNTWCSGLTKYQNYQTPWDLAISIAGERDHGPSGSSATKWKQGLLTLLEGYTSSNCSDERDLLYALLGMTHETWFKVDYTLSVEDVFTNFVIGLIENHKNYFVLHYVRDDRDYSGGSVKALKELDLPSWVPDWRRLLFGQRNFGDEQDDDPDSDSPTPSQAGGTGPISYSLSPSQKELTVEGFLVGSLHSRSWEVLKKLRNYSQSWFDFNTNKSSKNLPDDAEYWGPERSVQEVVTLVRWLDLYDQYMLRDGPSSIEDASRLQPLALTLVAVNMIDSKFFVYKRGASSDEITRDAMTFFLAAKNGDYKYENGRILVRGARYFYACSQLNLTRTFFIIDRHEDTVGERYIGLGPKWMNHGDVIAVFTGARTPFVLRPQHRDNVTKYQLVGECYVHGLMSGEIFTKDGAQMRHFTLM